MRGPQSGHDGQTGVWHTEPGQPCLALGHGIRHITPVADKQPHRPAAVRYLPAQGHVPGIGRKRIPFGLRNFGSAATAGESDRRMAASLNVRLYNFIAFS